MKRFNFYNVKLVKEKGVSYDVPTKKISTPEYAAELGRIIFDIENEPVEKFCMLALNVKNEVIGAHVVNIGCLSEVKVSIRSIFQKALLNNAASIICYHNHPSGHVDVSEYDKQLTRQLMEAGEIIGIRLLDHIIIGDGESVSLKSLGYIYYND
jgi:DNA repair protein RadC